MINVVISPGAENISILKIVPALRGRGIDVSVGVNLRPDALNINFRNSIFVESHDVMNTPESIRTASNKQGFRMLMMRELPQIAPKCFPLRDEYGGIHLPPRQEFPLIVRPETHSQGRQFFFARNQFSLMTIIKNHPNLSHGIEVIYPNREFRIFCGKRFNGEVIVWKTVEKIPTFAPTGELRRDVRPKNFHRGNSIFRLVADFRHKENIKQAALDSFKLSGLHFGAVDVLFDTERNIPFVIEINTRFALEVESTIDCFVKYLFKYYKDWERANG